MTSVRDVRRQIADIINDNIEGLRASDIVPEQMTGPIAVVARAAFDPRYVFSGSTASYRFRVTIYMPATSDRTAQNLLDDWLETTGPTSVLAAIEDGDLWTNVTVDFAQVFNIGEVQKVAIDTADYLLAALDVEVVF